MGLVISSMYCVNGGTKSVQPTLLTGDALIPAC
nr:MAG TPA: hypothetical protein [Caudoviricetes sp.]